MTHVSSYSPAALPPGIARALDNLESAQRDYETCLRQLAICPPQLAAHIIFVTDLANAQDRLATALGEWTRAGLRHAQESAK